jgi:hypothetical protein
MKVLSLLKFGATCNSRPSLTYGWLRFQMGSMAGSSQFLPRHWCEVQIPTSFSVWNAKRAMLAPNFWPHGKILVTTKKIPITIGKILVTTGKMPLSTGKLLRTTGKVQIHAPYPGKRLQNPNKNVSQHFLHSTTRMSPHAMEWAIKRCT